MRKFLILGLVVAFSASAMATAVYFDVITPPQGTGPGGIPSYEASTWIEVGLFGDVDAATILMTVAGSANATVDAPADLNAGLQHGGASGGVVKNGQNGVLLLEVTGSVDSGEPQYVIPGTALFTFLVHVDGEYSDIIIIDDLNGPNPFFPPTPPPSLQSKLNAVAVDAPPLEIHVTPEPMTVALLGLGGLFLRRRK